VHPWFIEEFIAAEGPQTLPSYPYWNIYEARPTIDFIHEALRTLSSYEHIYLWLTCLHSCLVSIGLSLQGRVRYVREENVIGRARLRKSGRFLEELKSLTEGWKDHREGRHSSSDMVLQRQPVPTDDEQLSQDPQDSREPIYQVNAKDWTTEEWDALQNLTNEVTPGLRRGYIMLGPSEGWDRYLRDPDGMCAHP
jgi:hypothetical protein